MKRIRFYSAYVSTNVNEPFAFHLEELMVKQVFADGTIELRYIYYIDNNRGTKYFAGNSGNAIDCEYKLGNGCVFYSTDKYKCMVYLIGKRKELNDYCDKIRSQLKESYITTRYLDD